MSSDDKLFIAVLLAIWAWAVLPNLPYPQTPAPKSAVVSHDAPAGRVARELAACLLSAFH